MNRQNSVIEYLLNNANDAIRYRVLTEFCDVQASDEVDRLRNSIIASERYKKLIHCLKERKEYHGATLYAVENSLNMLVDMGVSYQKGFMEFDEVLESIGGEVCRMSVNNNHVLGQLSHIVIVPFLLRAGIREPWIIDFFLERVGLIHKFVSKKQYDIYEGIAEQKNVPRPFRGRPIIREELYADGRICFPLEHDIYGCAAIYQEVEDGVRQQIDDIIEYIMDQRFQTIEDGYGILRKQNNYWAMGWDPKPTDLSKNYKYNPILLKADLLVTFPQVKASRWFADVVEELQQYVDENGICHFSKEFLTEKDSNWILGCHMGLGENRRKKTALEIEGTFRASKIINAYEVFKLDSIPIEKSHLLW